MHALYEQMTGREVAEKYGVTYGAVYHRLRTMGLSSRRHRPGPNRTQRTFNPKRTVLAKLIKKMSMAEIAKYYGVGETVVFMRLKEYGIEGPSRSERLTGKKKTLAHRLAMAKVQTGRIRGDKHHNWKGGISRSAYNREARLEYRLWKEMVLEASNFKCSKCGVEQGTFCRCCGQRTALHAHHLKPYADHPNLRYDVSNGIALCSACHWKEHHGKSGELLETPESRVTTTKPVTASVKV